MSESSKLTRSGQPSDGYDYVRNSYGIDPQIGSRVAVDGLPGVLVRGVDDQYLHVRFDSGWTAPAHPTWRVEWASETSNSEVSDGER